MTCNHHWHVSPEQKGCGPELQTCCRCDARRDVMNRNTGFITATNCHTAEGKEKFGRMVPDYDWASVRNMDVGKGQPPGLHTRAGTPTEGGYAVCAACQFWEAGHCIRYECETKANQKCNAYWPRSRAGIRQESP